jgi:homoserine kinase
VTDAAEPFGASPFEAFRAGAVTVRPPATSANLGPGFDALGLALELRDEVTVEVTAEPGLSIEVRGEGAQVVPCDENHLIVRSLYTAFAAAGVRPAGLRVVCVNRIPHGRGLGSSSAAICAGLVAARELVVEGLARLGDEELLDLATEIEGHPDNVAPALHGGLTVAWSDTAREPMEQAAEQNSEESQVDENAAHGPTKHHIGVLRLDPDPSISAVAFIPPTNLATEQARRLLPDQVPHWDAAFNAGRAGLLTVALTAHRQSAEHRAMLLYAGTEDRLHQTYRAAAMPESAALIRRLRDQGHAAVVSGAGPTVLVLATERDRADAAAAQAPAGWRAERLAIAADGVLRG